MPRCEHCKIKKTGLIPFTCRCNYKNLCIKCRLPNDHNCIYDYKIEGKNILEKELLIIVATKVEKI